MRIWKRLGRDDAEEKKKNLTSVVINQINAASITRLKKLLVVPAEYVSAMDNFWRVQEGINCR